MLKLILYIVIICTGAGSGYLMARSYENRIYHLQELVTALRILEAEMNYRRDPLPVLLRRIGKKTDGLAGKFFVQVCKQLEGSYSYDFYGSWGCSVESTYRESSLNKKDREVLTEVGIELGKTDLINQQSFFARVYERLNQQITEATEEKRTKGKMYKTLGAAFGVLAVIVLL